MIKLDDHLKSLFGEKVYKISLTSGCTCPNRDGSKGYGGCIFCSEKGSGDFAEIGNIEEQFQNAKKRIAQKTNARKFIAYFQSFSNTYGDVNRLYDLYEYVIKKDEVVILSIGTRPDCINDDVLNMLERLTKIKQVWVELGLQSIKKSTAEFLNLQYNVDDFYNAFLKLKSIGVKVITHVIFGLPCETKEEQLKTIEYLSKLEPKLDGIKIHALQVLKNTKLAEIYQEKPFDLLSLEEYGEMVKRAFDILPSDIVSHRITGDPPRALLIEPKWTIDKKKNLNYLYKLLK